MKTLGLLMLLGFTSAPTFAQDASPMKIEVCHAKATIWEADSMTGEIKKVPYVELEKRLKEMNQCLMDDPSRDSAEYAQETRIMWSYSSEQKWRLEAYLKRYNLLFQFRVEDTAQTQARAESEKKR